MTRNVPTQKKWRLVEVREEMGFIVRIYRNAFGKTYTQKVKQFDHFKHLVKTFVSQEKRDALNGILSEVKLQLMSYDKEDYKHAQLVKFGKNLWKELKSEFYRTADISDNTIWKNQDFLETFDEQGYLIVEDREGRIDAWVEKMEGWYDIMWPTSVLNLIKDFNLDCQPSEYANLFMDDFQQVKNQPQFCSAITKWTDLIFWSPWKLELLAGKIEEPRGSHYEDEFNPETVDSDDILD